MIDTMSDTPLGLTEIGELLGVSRQRAFTLSKRADFPKPSATLKAGRIWDQADIEEWEKTWDRSNQGGRPKRKLVDERPPPEPEAATVAAEVPDRTAALAAPEEAWHTPVPGAVLSDAVFKLPAKRATILMRAVEQKHPEWTDVQRIRFADVPYPWFFRALLQAAIDAGHTQIPGT